MLKEFMLPNIYEEISQFKKIAKSNLKIIDKKISKMEEFSISLGSKNRSEIDDFYRSTKERREELNSLYFKVNVHNLDFSSGKKEFMDKSVELLKDIFNIEKNTKIL